MKTLTLIGLIFISALFVMGQEQQSEAPLPTPTMPMIKNILTSKDGTINELMLNVEQYRVQVEQLRTIVAAKDAELKKAEKAPCKDKQ